MLQAKLSPCASLLYQWVLLRVTSDNNLKIDLQDFQAWTGEFRERSYSYAEVFEALSQLKDLNLVNVSRTEVTLEAKVSDYFCFSTEAETASETEIQPKKVNRWGLLGKILLVSTIFSAGSVAIGVNLLKSNPEVLDIPHPWSALSGDRQ